MQYIDLNSVPTLTYYERSSIREHCALSGLIRRMSNIRTFLINQVHEKRADCKRGRFKPRGALIEKLYASILFGGKKRLSSYYIFPLSFRSYLDDLLCRSVCREHDTVLGFSVCGVYFDSANVPPEELHSAFQFDPAEWELNDPAEDQAVLFRFRDEFIEALQHLVNSVQRLGLSAKKDVAELKREVARYSKAANTPSLRVASVN
jgi:hypothetical protein